MQDNALILIRAYDALALSLRRFLVFRDVKILHLSVPITESNFLIHKHNFHGRPVKSGSDRHLTSTLLLLQRVKESHYDVKARILEG